LTNVVNNRLSTLTTFAPLGNSENKNIYLPEKYHDLIKGIYDSFPLKRESSLKTMQKNLIAKNGTINSSMHMKLNIAFIKVIEYGENTFDEIISKWKYYKLERAHSIYLHLNLEDEHTPHISAKANEIGFIYSGIIPYHLNGKDTLILQYTNMRIDFDEIKLFQDESKKILNFIKKEYEETYF